MQETIRVKYKGMSVANEGIRLLLISSSPRGRHFHALASMSRPLTAVEVMETNDEKQERGGECLLSLPLFPNLKLHHGFSGRDSVPVVYSFQQTNKNVLCYVLLLLVTKTNLQSMNIYSPRQVYNSILEEFAWTESVRRESGWQQMSPDTQSARPQFPPNGPAKRRRHFYSFPPDWYKALL